MPTCAVLLDIRPHLEALLAHINPWVVIALLTAVNTASGMVYFLLGWLCKWEWLERYLHVDLDRLTAVHARVERYGVLAALLSWAPFIGTPIAIALGLMHANPRLTCLLMLIVKFLRNLVIVSAIAFTL